MLRSIRASIRNVLRRSQVERKMSEEFQFHLDQRTAVLIAAGLAPDAARRRALVEFGTVDARKEECREARGLRLADELRADLLYVTRLLRRSPWFTGVAIGSVALGVGLTTLVFSVLNALVLRPLPIQRSDEVVFVENAGRDFPSHSFPNYLDLRDRNESFAGLFGYRVSPMNVEIAGTAHRVWGYLATGNYFDVLGVAPALGRVFHQDDDRQPGASPLAVLSHEFWRIRFGSDTAIVGTTLRINRQPYTIIGVAPPGFHGTERIYYPDIWVPMMMQAQIEVGNPWLDDRNTSNVWITGRLAPGVTIAQAQANLNVIGAHISREHPSSNRDLKYTLARPGLIGDTLGAPVRMFTLGVFVLAALVLTAGCANLASLLLARGADRQREMAVRISMGAGRARLLRQVLTESLVLSMLGGLAGVVIATAASAGLSAWRAPLEFPIQFDIRPDWRVFLFALAISTAAGILFGLAPAHQAARTDPNATLKGTAGVRLLPRTWAFRDLLVLAQIALSSVLITGSLLSVRGLYAMLTAPVGLNPQGVGIVGFELALAGYSESEGRLFQQRALEAVRRLPGVQEAAYANSLPLSIDVSTTTIVPEDRGNLQDGDALRAIYYQVSPGFFRTLGIPLLAGRGISRADDPGAPLVAVVNSAFVRRILQTERPVGKRFRYGGRGPWTEVIGVVADGKYQSLTEAPRPVVFRSILQSYNSTTTVVARSSLPLERLVASMTHAIATLDPGLPVHGAGTFEELLDLPLLPSRAAAIALSAFGLLAIVLSATGIHGLVSYAVAQRQQEIGIRLAMGASRLQVLTLVLHRIAVLLLVGSAAGMLLAVSAGSVLSSIVYQVSPRDPLTLAGVIAIVVALSVFACWPPVYRALRLDPASALRAQ